MMWRTTFNAALSCLLLSVALSATMRVTAQTSDDTAGNETAGNVTDGTEPGKPRVAAPWRSARVNETTVGLVFSAEQRFALPGAELAGMLADSAELRLVNIMGRNHVLNLYDLVYLVGVDATLVRSDTLEFVSRRNEFPGITRVVNVLASLGDDRAVVLTSNAIESIEDLNGKTIAVGEQGSGEHISGTLLLELLDIDATTTNMSTRRAIEQLGNGEVDAVVQLIGRASGGGARLTPNAADNLVAKLGDDDGVNVLPIPLDAALREVYTAAELTHDDLPGLLAQNENVPTIGIPLIIAAYRWSPRNPRYDQATRFVEALMQGRDRLQAGAHSAYWSQLEFDADIPGVGRLNIVGTLLAEREREAQAEREREAAAKADETAALEEEVARKRAEIRALLQQRAKEAENPEALQLLLDDISTLLDDPGEGAL